MLPLQQFGVGFHGGRGFGQIGKGFGAMLLDEQVDRRAAGGDQDVLFPRGQNLLVTILDELGPPGGFLHPGETKRFEGFLHAGKPSPGERR